MVLTALMPFASFADTETRSYPDQEFTKQVSTILPNGGPMVQATVTFVANYAEKYAGITQVVWHDGVVTQGGGNSTVTRSFVYPNDEISIVRINVFYNGNCTIEADWPH